MVSEDGFSRMLFSFAREIAHHHHHHHPKRWIGKLFRPTENFLGRLVDMKILVQHKGIRRNSSKLSALWPLFQISLVKGCSSQEQGGVLHVLSSSFCRCLAQIEGVFKRYPEIGDRPKRFYRILQKVLSNPQKGYRTPKRAHAKGVILSEEACF